ncbi:MAG: type IV pilus biogenesis protein PilM [Luteitalea sp.]
MSPLPAWLQTPSPTLGLELDAHRVTAVLIDRHATPPLIRASASVPLPPGAILPSLTAANIPGREQAVRAVREVVDQVGGRQRRVALVIPDTAAKVSLLPFEQVPSSPRDLEQLIRLQLRKTVPFPLEQAQVSWAGGPVTGAGATFAVAAMRRAIVEEYEGVCAAAGLHAGAVDLSTFNVVNVVLLADAANQPPSGDWLLVHVTPGYASIVIVRNGEIIFFRTRRADADEPVPDVVHQTRMFYEDRLTGQGFSRVLLAGGSDVADRAALVREIESRLDARVTALTLAGVATFGDRIGATDQVLSQVVAPAGLVLREGHP